MPWRSSCESSLFAERLAGHRTEDILGQPWVQNKDAHLKQADRTKPTPPQAHLAFQGSPFHPVRWLPGPHLQTLAGKLLRPRVELGLERLRIETPDGDFLDLDLGPDPGAEAPFVVVLHGLEGSTRRAYVRTAMAALTRAGMRAIGMNFRSCSGVPNRRARFYHSGETGDISFVLDLLREKFPGRTFGALGFSLGGNVLLRYLGEKGDSPPPCFLGAAAISVPYDLTEGSRMLEVGWMGRIYTRYFLRSLQKKARAKRHLLNGVVDLDRILEARNLREFDEAATAPLHGFRDAREYYRQASSGPVLPAIRVPTYLLHAMDDPFLPGHAVPHEAVDENPWLVASFSGRGGHVGFVGAGPPWRPIFWAETEAIRYLATILKAP